jgi:hypothetical protein
VDGCPPQNGERRIQLSGFDTISQHIEAGRYPPFNLQNFLFVLFIKVARVDPMIALPDHGLFDLTHGADRACVTQAPCCEEFAGWRYYLQIGYRERSVALRPHPWI